MDGATLLAFILGALALVAGAESLVRGASRLAVAAGVSPLVVGLTVVAYGTGAPELAVAIRSALTGQGAVTVGNVVGANILNILWVLGASAIARPLILSRRLVRQDVPVMIAAAFLLWLFALDGRLNRWEGLLLFAGVMSYTLYVVREGRRRGPCPENYPEGLCPEAAAEPERHWLLYLALVGLGLLLLGLGATALVNAAVLLARALGVSELAISLTVVALGTTLPEVATSVVAALRGETDLAVGNVVGSVIFNILGVLAVAGIVAPTGLAVPVDAVRFDIPVMVGVTLACLPIFFVGHRLARWEGILFVCYYIVYTTYLYLRAVEHLALASFSRALLYFVLPLTAVTLAVYYARTLQAERTAARRDERRAA